MGTLEVVTSIVTGVVGSILAVECILLAEPLSDFLVRRAARILPETQRQHYESEWLQKRICARAQRRDHPSFSLSGHIYNISTKGCGDRCD
jgi:hypothetical protein